MTRILFYLEGFPHAKWEQAFKGVDPTVDFRSYPDWGDPSDGPAYAFVWGAPAVVLRQYPNIKAIFSLGAGVDHLTRDPNLPKKVPIIRMGNEQLKKEMAEYVLMNVLMHHRGMPYFIANQRKHIWKHRRVLEADELRVGFLGYGFLAKAAAEAIRPIGYQVNTWSTSPKEAENNTTHYTGREKLKDFLTATDILVCLLPETAETRNLLNKETLSYLPPYASLINAGRGSLIDLDDLMITLDEGTMSAATLDVFPEEPLSDRHPAWDHEKILVTPHIAAGTRPSQAAAYALENIKRIEAGQDPLNVYNHEKGY